MPDLETPIKSLSSAGRGGPQSVGRIIGILEHLAETPSGTTLSELALIVGAPKTSLVGLLAGLNEEGFLLREETGRYFLGPRFLALAARVVGGRDLATLVRPLLARLVEETGETAILGALDRDENIAVYVDKVETSNPIRYAVTIGERRELYCTAVGKAFLAHFPEEQLKDYLRNTARTRFTDTTITSQRELRDELSRIRGTGVSVTNAERIAGASGIAAPIFGPNNAIHGVLMIAGPTDRIHSNGEFNQTAVRKAALEASRLAGGDPKFTPTGTLR